MKRDLGALSQSADMIARDPSLGLPPGDAGARQCSRTCTHPLKNEEAFFHLSFRARHLDWRVYTFGMGADFHLAMPSKAPRFLDNVHI